MQPLFLRRRTLSTFVAAATLSLLLPLALPLAADADDQAASATPATTAVARIDAISGDAAIQRGDDNETLAAVANAPILSADYVTTGNGGRAEIGFDGHAAVRLGENVQMRFPQIDPANRQMQLAAGTIELRLFGDTDGQSQIDTPSISVVPRTAGSFRVSVDDNGDTAVTVRSGRADIVTPAGTQSLEPGTTLVASGPAANPSIQTQAAVATDDFDAYNADRDQVYQVAQTDSRYVDTDIQGVGDLNADGRWVDDGSYGNVWIPTDVAPGWAPYRDGSWTWEDSYGWTWVAAEPWGWAPYHYGRWYYSAGYRSWAWFPPPPARFAPAWSPALVGFVGFNVGAVSVGIGFGNIGWVPLAPYEAFHPWWGPHGGTTIVNNVTYANSSVHYRNMEVNGALTSVSREDFQAGRFAHPTVVSAETLRSVRAVPVTGALPIVPSQANLHFTQRPAPAALAARSALPATSFAGHATFAPRTPFSEQQASVARVTHVAYRASSTSYGRPATAPGDPWSRFSATRSQAPESLSRPQSNDSRVAAPGYAQPQYNRNAAPAYSQPQYNRAAAPTYAQSQYNRSAAPAYSQPQYNRNASAAYSNRPQVNRAASAAYSRPAARSNARPDARATHSHG
jgi:hypothetical protein